MASHSCAFHRIPAGPERDSASESNGAERAAAEHQRRLREYVRTEDVELDDAIERAFAAVPRHRFVLEPVGRVVKRPRLGDGDATQNPMPTVAAAIAQALLV